MAKKGKSASKGNAALPARAALPSDLELRLAAVWDCVGGLVEWCDSREAWLQLFCSEARPYRETFYWESIARLVGEFLQAHPEAVPARVLTDCLIATQCPPLPDDRAVLRAFHASWQALQAASRDAIERGMQADLELARAEGTLDAVAALYAADRAARPETAS